jgi:hypothetical protein
MQLVDVGGVSQGQDELTRLSWNVLLDKDMVGQVARSSGKLTRGQPITNVVSR